MSFMLGLEGLKKLKLDRIISIATLLASLCALFLVLKKPQPVAAPQTPAAAAANAQSFQTKLDEFEQAKQGGQSQPEVHLTADEINAAVAQAAGLVPAASQPSAATPGNPSASASSKPGTTTEGLPLPAGISASDGQPNVKDYQLSFEGDLVKGQFLTEVAGKDVWVTLAGHLGSKDGYATFDPTEFKVGDLNVPVSLVNDALQKKLLEQRDRLKLPDSVGDMKVENGELVMK
jgi:hypothetical protein